MGTSDGILLLVLVFFGLLLHAVHREDKRRCERRQQDLPHSRERRQGERRSRRFAASLAWALKAPWPRRGR
jgi:hypothetical protein